MDLSGWFSFCRDYGIYPSIFEVWHSASPWMHNDSVQMSTIKLVFHNADTQLKHNLGLTEFGWAVEAVVQVNIGVGCQWLLTLLVAGRIENIRRLASHRASREHL